MSTTALNERHLLAAAVDARIRIASRVGERLTLRPLSEADRVAAEALARELAADAIERVRQALAEAVKHARFLPHDVALKIAHDVDAVACPFLEVTEVFSDSDWQQLVLTISRGARIAVARRKSLSESLALALAENHDTVVAETLIANTGAPMTSPVCHALIERAADSVWVLEKLAERKDLLSEIVIKLCRHVSRATQEKLTRSYGLIDFTAPIVAEAELHAVLGVIRDTPQTGLLSLAEGLMNERKLTPDLVLDSLRDGSLQFLSAALAILSGERLSQVQAIVLHGGAGPMIRLLAQAHIPNQLHDEFWNALSEKRSESAPT